MSVTVALPSLFAVIVMDGYTDPSESCDATVNRTVDSVRGEQKRIRRPSPSPSASYPSSSASPCSSPFSSPSPRLAKHRSTDAIPGDIRIRMDLSENLSDALSGSENNSLKESLKVLAETVKTADDSLPSVSSPSVFLSVDPYLFHLSFYVRERWRGISVLITIAKLFKIFALNGRHKIYGEMPNKYPISKQFTLHCVEINGKAVFDASDGASESEISERVSACAVRISTSDFVSIRFTRVEPVAIVHLEEIPPEGREMVREWERRERERNGMSSPHCLPSPPTSHRLLSPPTSL